MHRLSAATPDIFRREMTIFFGLCFYWTLYVFMPHNAIPPSYSQVASPPLRTWLCASSALFTYIYWRMLYWRRRVACVRECVSQNSSPSRHNLYFSTHTPGMPEAMTLHFESVSFELLSGKAQLQRTACAPFLPALKSARLAFIFIYITSCSSSHILMTGL